MDDVSSQAPLELTVLYASLRTEICQVLRARFGEGPPEPEDMVQAAFAKLAALEDPSKIENPRAFLYAAARNLTIDELRRNGRFKRHERELADRAEEDSSDQTTPERVLLAKERCAIVRDTIAAMPEAQRAVLTLHRIEGLSMDAIARRMGTSKTTVHRQIVNAIAQLHRATKK